MISIWCTTDSIDDEVKRWAVDISSLFHKEVNYPIEMQTLNLIFYYCFGQNMNNLNDTVSLLQQLEKHNLPYLVQNPTQQGIDLQLRVLFNYVKKAGRPMYALYNLNQKLQNEQELKQATQQLKDTVVCQQPQQVTSSQLTSQVLCDLQQLTFNSKWSEAQLSKLQQATECLIDQQLLIAKLNIDQTTLSFSDLMQTYVKQYENYIGAVKQLINITADEQSKDLISQNINDSLKYLCEIYQQLQNIPELEDGQDYRLRIFGAFVSNMNIQIIFDTIQLFKKAISNVESQGIRIIIDETIIWPQEEPNINLDHLESLVNKASNEQTQPLIKDCLYSLVELEIEQYYNLFSSSLSLVNKREAFQAFQNHIPILDNIINIINVEQDSELLSHYKECKKFASLIDNIDSKTPSTTINQFRYQVKASTCYDMLVTFFGQYKSNLIKDTCINLAQLEEKLQRSVDEMSNSIQLPSITQISGQMLDIKQNILRQIPSENDINELLLLNNQMTQQGEKQVQDNLYVKNIELLYNLAVQQNQSEIQENQLLEKAILNGKTINKEITDNIKEIVSLVEVYKGKYTEAQSLQLQAANTLSSITGENQQNNIIINPDITTALHLSEQSLQILDQLLFDINYNNHGDFILPKFEQIYTSIYSQVFTSSILTEDYVVEVIKTLNLLIHNITTLTAQIISTRNILLEQQKFYFSHQILLPQFQHQIENVVNFINNFQQIASILIHFDFQKNQTDINLLKNLENQILNLISKSLSEEEFILLKSNIQDEDEVFVQDFIIQTLSSYTQLIKSQKQILPTYLNLICQMGILFEKDNKDLESQQIQNLNNLLEKYEQSANKYQELIDILMGMGKSYEFGFDLTASCRDKLIKNAQNVEISLDSFQIVQLTKKPNLTLNYQLFDELKELLKELDLQVKRQECGRDNKNQIQMFVRQSVKDLYDVLVKLNPKDIKGLEGQQIQDNIISRSQVSTTRISEQDSLQVKFDVNKYVTSQINMIVNHDVQSNADYVDNCPLQSIQIFDQICDQIRQDITVQVANKQLQDNTINAIIDVIDGLSNIINDDIKLMIQYYQMVINGQQFNEQEYNTFYLLQQESNSYIIIAKFINQLYETLTNVKYNIPQEKLPTISTQDVQQVIQYISQFQSVQDKVNKQNIQKLSEKVQQRKDNQVFKFNHEQMKKVVKELSQKQDFLSACSRKILTLLNAFLQNGGIADQEIIDISEKAQEKLIRDSGNNDIVVQIKAANKYILNLSQGKKTQQPFYNKAIQTQAINSYSQTLILPQSATCMDLLQKCNFQAENTQQLCQWNQYISDIVKSIEQIQNNENNDEKIILLQNVHESVNKLIQFNIQTNLLNQKQISESFDVSIKQILENQQISDEIKQLLNNDAEILRNLSLQSAKFIDNQKFKQQNEKMNTQLQQILVMKNQYENEDIILNPIFAQFNQMFNKYQLTIQQEQSDISKTIKDMIYQGCLDLNKEQVDLYISTTLKAQQDLDQICILIQNQFKQNQLSQRIQQQIYQIIKKIVQFYNNINLYNLSFNRAYDTIIDSYLYKQSNMQQLQLNNQMLKDSQEQMRNGKISDLYNKYYDTLLTQAEQYIKDHKKIIDNIQHYKNISYKAYNYLSNSQDSYEEKDDEEINQQIEQMQKNKEELQIIKNQLTANINIKFQALILQVTSLLFQQTETLLTKVFINRETLVNQFQVQQGQMRHNIMDVLITYGDKIRACQLQASKTAQQKLLQKQSKEQLKLQATTQQQQQQEIEKLLQDIKPAINEQVQKQINLVDYKLSSMIKRWLYSDFENQLNKYILVIGQQLTTLYLQFDKCNKLQYDSVQKQQTVIYIKHIQTYISKIEQVLQDHLNRIYDVLEKKEQYDKQEFDEEILFLVQGRYILEQLAMMTPYYEEYEEQLKEMQQILFKCVNIHFKNCFDQDFQDNKKMLFNVYCNQIIRELLDISTQFQQAVQIDGCDFSERKLIEFAKLMQKIVQLTIQNMQTDYQITIEDDILQSLNDQTQYNNTKLLPYYNKLSELQQIWNNNIVNNSQLPLMTTRVIINTLSSNIKETIKSTLPGLQCCQALGLWKGQLLQTDLTTAIMSQLEQSKEELQLELQQLIDSHQSYADEEQVQYSSIFTQTPLIYQAQIRSLLIAIEAAQQATPIECIEHTNLSSIKFYEKLNKCQFDDCYSITLQLGNYLQNVQQLFEYDKEDKQLIIRKPQQWSFFAPSLSLQNSYINKINNNGQIFSVLNKCYLLTVNKQFDTQQPVKQAKISFTSTYTLEQTVYEQLESIIKKLITDSKQILDCYTSGAQSHQLLQSMTFKPIFDKLLTRAYIAQQFLLQLCHEIGIDFSSQIQSPNDIYKNLFVGQKSIQLLESTFDQLNYQDKKSLQQTVIQLRDNFNEIVSKIILYNSQSTEQIRQSLTKAYLQTQQISKQEANKLFAVMCCSSLFNMPAQNLLSQLVFDDDQFENNFIDEEFASQCYQFVQQYESLSQVLDDNKIDNQVQKRVISSIFQIVSSVLEENKEEEIYDEEFQTEIMHKSINNIQQLISQPWKIQKYIFLSTIGQDVNNLYKGGLSLRKLSEQYQEIIGDNQQQQLNNIKLIVNQQDMLSKTQQFQSKDTQKQQVFNIDVFKQQLQEIKQFYIQELEQQEKQYDKHCQEGKQQLIDLMQVIITNCQSKFALTQLQTIDQQQILQFQAQGDYYYQQLHASLQILQVYDFKLQEQCGTQEIIVQNKQISKQVRKVLLELKSQIKNVILQFQDVDKEVTQIEQTYNCPYELYRRAISVASVAKQSEIEDLLEISGEVKDVSYDSKKIYEISDIEDKIMKFCSVVKKEINPEQLQEDTDDLLEVIRGKI